MRTAPEDDAPVIQQAIPKPNANRDTALRNGGAVAFAALAVTACGGDGGGGGGVGGMLPIAPSAAGPGSASAAPAPAAVATGSASAPTPSAPTPSAPADLAAPPPASPVAAGGETTSYTTAQNAQQAARFLAQATLGAPRSEITALQGTSYADWLDKQFALPRSQSHCEWLTNKGFGGGEANLYHPNGLDATLWRKFISSPDLLRQRITLALTELMVASMDNIITWFPQFSLGSYVDALEANAFGTYRGLLEAVTLSPGMSAYLTYRGNVLANPETGSQPDENYAREVMQLFTIGLYQLNNDGSLVLNNGVPVETYRQEDVSGLARVFTGWYVDISRDGEEGPVAQQLPLVPVPGLYESGAKTFLGVTIPAGPRTAQGARDNLKIALDTLCNHPNVPPFVGKQLIQRLVTSNPSPAYVRRVSQAFIDNGKGVRGDMKAVIRAILLDDEARNPAIARTPAFGKVREPMVRFLNWARAVGANSVSTNWNVGDLSDVATTLGQSPLHAQSVFNFFRPGFVPTGTQVGDFNLLAPELQISNESSVAGYINFMQRVVSGTALPDLKPDYSGFTSVAGDAAALLAEVNLVIAGGMVSDATLATLAQAVGSISANNDAGKRTRVYAAITLVMASPEYIVQK